VVDEEMSILDAIALTAQQMREAYRLPETSVILARWKRDDLIKRYGLEEVEAGEKRWNIQWVDDWTEVTEL
jgi:hypothetical protein